MTWNFRVFFVFVALVLAMGVACGGGLESSEEHTLSVQTQSDSRPAATPRPGAVPAAAPTPVPTGAPTPPPQLSGDTLQSGERLAGERSGRVQPALLPQNRIIVHTARISLVVDDVAQTVDSIADVAQGLGGWVVNSDRASKHSGSIAIRVPAQALDQAFLQVEALALEVESRAITSDDVTDEYVDFQSRLISMRATEERLLSFLERAGEMEDALLVQKEISQLQQQIEATQGRLNFLEQTAAYSLIEVYLKLTSEVIDVGAGGDMAVRVGQVARFRASFTAPRDINDFSFTWDFGDGESISGNGTVLRPEGHRVTATVNHVYDDDRDSPYIVTVQLNGTGEGGIAEGSDSIEVAVSHVPTIEVFAGEDLTVEESDDMEYTASFTRPSELWDYQYVWDFGDGSPTETGSLAVGATRVDTTHAFRDFRPTPYTATLTVTATSDAGQVSGSGSFSVRVTESEGLLVWGWDLGSTARGAVRALAGIAWVATTVAIWVAILSPVILVIIVAVYLIRRFGPRLNLGGPRGDRPVRRRSRSAWEEPMGEEHPVTGEEASPADGELGSTGGQPPAGER